MRVVILEPSAIDYDRSHNAKSLIGHTAVFQKHRIPVIWVTNIRSTLTSPNVRNYKEFRYTIYDDVRNKRTALIRKILFFYYRLLVHTSRRAIGKIFREAKIGSGDHLFIPTTDWILFRALMEFFRGRDIRNIPYIHFIVMYEQGDWMTGGYPYKKLVNKLNESGLLDSRVFVYTETKRHAESLQDSLGVEVKSYPFPSTPIPRRRKNRIENHIKVCALGGGRRDKGFQLLPMIIEKFHNACSEKDEVEFVIQRPRKRDKLNISEAMLESMSNVVLMDNQLGQEIYEDCLISCDLMIFPYDAHVYYARGSGLVNEAVANGKPILCTRDSSLEEQIFCKNGLVASGPDEFAKAIEEIISDLGVYKKRAVVAAGIYLYSYTNNPVVNRIKHLRSIQPAGN